MWKYEPSLSPLYCSSLKAHSALQKAATGTGRAGQWKQLVNKKKKKNLFPRRSSQNQPDRKGIGCAGWVTVDRVRATDEWVQEAVMSDIFHQTSQSDKKYHSRDKRTKVVCRLKTSSSVGEPAEAREHRVFIIYWKYNLWYSCFLRTQFGDKM